MMATRWKGDKQDTGKVQLAGLEFRRLHCQVVSMTCLVKGRG